MRFDYLENRETEYLTEQLRLRAIEDEGALRAECREASRCADASLARIPDMKAENDRRIADTLSKFAADLKQSAASLPIPSSMFRTVANVSAFPAVCSMILRAETYAASLRAAMDTLTDARNALHTEKGRLQRAVRFLSAARLAVGQTDRDVYSALIAYANHSGEGLIALEQELAAQQSRLIVLLAEQLPRFLNQIHQEADFNHNGAACKALSVRNLFGELAFAVEQSGIVPF